jgi:tetrapyrrole methylase family protein/MazG family protein
MLEKTRKAVFEKSNTRRFSSLAEALRLAQKAARTGFDWPNLAGVLGKLDEEIEELKEACSTGDRKKIEEELGDLLFVIVNIARFQKIHPEKALGKTVKKFKTRFRYIEASLQQRGKTLRQSNLAEMDELWEEAKKQKSKNQTSKS